MDDEDEEDPRTDARARASSPRERPRAVSRSERVGGMV
jgi:hypothetical protein